MKNLIFVDRAAAAVRSGSQLGTKQHSTLLC
jgi:hypothetical protein